MGLLKSLFTAQGRTDRKSIIILFTLCGLLIPIAFTLLSIFLINFPKHYLAIASKLQILQLLLWPSSIFMLASAGSGGIDFQMLSISIAVNILIYTIMGFCIWWAWQRQRWMLYVIGCLILVGWYEFLSVLKVIKF
jgi:hypothetical protein